MVERRELLGPGIGSNWLGLEGATPSEESTMFNLQITLGGRTTMYIDYTAEERVGE